MSSRIVKAHLGVGLVLLALFAVGCPGRVPNVVGMQESEARAALAYAGLAVGAVTTQHSGSVPEGRVISQSPEAGAVSGEGAAVDLAVSLGPEPVLTTAPDVTGLDEAAAEAAIVAAGLVVGEVDEVYSATVAAGLVVSQHPAAGASLVEGSAVDLVLSLGVEPVAVPDLVGMALEDAQAALTAGGCEVGVVSHEYNAAVAEGLVIRHTPAGGTPVLPGTAVDIVVSLGLEPGTAPYVKGMTIAQAETTLLAAGLAVGDVTEAYNKNVPAGRVMSQDPAAGAVVPAGSAVDLVVSLGPEPVEVPDLVGMTQEEALAALPVAKLLPGTLTEEFRLDVAPGTVVGQDPGAGVIVDEDTAVDLVVATDFRLISTIEQLESIGKDPDYPLDAKYALINDLYVTAQTKSDGAGKQYTGPFEGIFDGRGHSITGMPTAARYNAVLSPFYETASTAVIKNLRVRDTNLRDYDAVAGLCLVNRGTILNCTVEGNVWGRNDMCTGGVVGVNDYGGVVRGCAFEGRIEEGEGYVGGVVGANSGRVENCRFSGEIAGDVYDYDYYYYYSYTGGIVGTNWGYILGCSADGTIRTRACSGGIVGDNVANMDTCESWCRVLLLGSRGGGVAGTNSGRISQCGNYGLVYSSGGGIVGGLVGENHDTIELSFAAGAVIGNGEATGGLAGESSRTITSSFSTAYVQGVENCGGLVGRQTSGSLVECYSAGMVNATGVAGGLVGASIQNVYVYKCFWNIESSGQPTSAGGTGIDTDQLLTRSTFTDAGWAYSDEDGIFGVWAQVEGQTVPYLAYSVAPGTMYPLDVSAVNGSVVVTPDQDEYAAWSLVKLEPAGDPEYVLAGWDLFGSEPEHFLQTDVLYMTVHQPTLARAVYLPRPIQITTIEELQQIGRETLYPISWDYVLANDIDAHDTQSWNDGQGFLPIGDVQRPFAGSLDGQGHSINALVINRADEEHVGLFSVVGPEAGVANVHVVDAFVAGKTAGILAGESFGVISDSTVSGTVAGEMLGGLVAYNRTTLVYPDALETEGGLIERCRSSATVAGLPYSSTGVGGFCAVNEGTIRECCSVGPVMGVAFVGGFLSYAEYGATTCDCYATGPVSGYMSVGGFTSVPYGNIKRSYAAGHIEGEMECGGFSAYFPYYYYKESSKYYSSDCFWDYEATGVFYSYDSAMGLPTEDMMTAQPFIDAGWDFDNVWAIDEGNSYPYLRWEAEGAE